MKIVYVVTGIELGWDCIVGVFDARSLTKEELEKKFNPKLYVIFEKDVEATVEGWGD